MRENTVIYRSRGRYKGANEELGWTILFDVQIKRYAWNRDWIIHMLKCLRFNCTADSQMKLNQTGVIQMFFSREIWDLKFKPKEFLN